MRIQYKFSLILLACTLLPIIVGGFFLYQHYRYWQTKTAVESLRAVAFAKKDLLEKIIEKEGRRIRLVTGNNHSRINLSTLNSEEVSQILDPIVKDYTGLGKTGDIYVAKKDNSGKPVFVTTPRFKNDAPGQHILYPRIFLPANTEATHMNARDYRGEEVIAITLYLHQVEWALIVKKDRKEVFESINQAGNMQIAIIFAMVLVMSFVAWLVAIMVTEPISRLHRSVDLMSKGDLSQRVDVRTHDEIGLLSVSFNTMAQRMERMTNELRQREYDLEEKVRERTVLAERRAEKLRELALTLTITEQKERRRLAEILHDHLQQVLIAARIGLRQMKQKFLDADSQRQMIEIEKLLDDAVLESRSLTLELSPPLLRDAGLSAALEWLARWFKEKYQLDVVVESEAEMTNLSEEIKIYLFQAVRELLLNVVKHAETNEVFIRVFTQNHEIGICVKDFGKGFDANRLSREGKGFGLSNIQERIKLLGGHMEIESEVGDGASFELFVPEDKTGDVKGDVKEKIKIKNNDAIEVLVVDDHKILRQGLINMLEEDPGIKVIGEAADGEEALKKVAELLPEIVIMDISLPKIIGVEVTRQIKESYPDIQIIGLSIHDSKDMEDNMKRAGATAYFSKAGPIDLLIDTIYKISYKKGLI